MKNDALLSRLPSQKEVGKEIVDTACRLRRLRSLYRLLCVIESDPEIASSPGLITANRLDDGDGDNE